MSYFLLLPQAIFWWYGEGVKSFFAFFLALFQSIINFFSLKTIFFTLFSPWKKMVGERHKGIDGLKDWFLDNFVSRFVGFVVRIIMIISALISITLGLCFFVVSLLFWLLFPFIFILLFLNIFIGVI